MMTEYKDLERAIMWFSRSGDRELVGMKELVFSDVQLEWVARYIGVQDEDPMLIYVYDIDLFMMEWINENVVEGNRVTYDPLRYNYNLNSFYR